MLLPFVKRQRNARLPQYLQVAKDRAAADAAFQG